MDKKTNTPVEPEIRTIAEKRLVGKQLILSLAGNQTIRLWQSFMPFRNAINNRLSSDLISMQVYPSTFDFTFSNPWEEFQKWAAAEVNEFEAVPDGMETFTLMGGQYAVFQYKGSSTDDTIFKYIFGTWLPASGYLLDDRPHFEILGAKYRNNDPESEEEIWIPIKPK